MDFLSLLLLIPVMQQAASAFGNLHRAFQGQLRTVKDAKARLAATVFGTAKVVITEVFVKPTRALEDLILGLSTVAEQLWPTEHTCWKYFLAVAICRLALHLAAYGLSTAYHAYPQRHRPGPIIRLLFHLLRIALKWTKHYAARMDAIWSSLHPWEAVESKWEPAESEEDLQEEEMPHKPSCQPEQRAVAILGLGQEATQRDIRLAYLRQCKALHPDKNVGRNNEDNVERLRAVLTAYETLTNHSCGHSTVV